MFVNKVLIFEEPSINGFSTSSISFASCYVTTLDQQDGENPVEDSSFIVEEVSIWRFSFFACAETTEVLRSFGAICIERDFDST